jgi:CheY-like chemotaxis protein
LASLRERAPGAVADVAYTLRDTAELERLLSSRHGVELHLGPVPPELKVEIHPSALRQVLIAAIGQLLQHMSSGKIMLCAEHEEGHVRIGIAGCPVRVDQAPMLSFIREILDAHGGSVEVDSDGTSVSLWVKLPAVGESIVLVVDDNPESAHFYRRCVGGTRYHVVHVTEGQRVFQDVETFQPEVIVLDIMLPDVDGWELLALLHERPATRTIPVIVCSVIRERDLALALGAALYLPKPVRCRQFILAMDRALDRASAAAPRAPTNSGAAGSPSVPHPS